ncbi:MAG: hypothetical protein HYV90_02985 [Candidatus Woesebacteria bacterium]|nr:MAG: hypothetical protein HYV90_02985 [Candidatus Woesebacteria bacterium]
MNRYFKILFYILLILIPSLFVFMSFFKNLHLSWGDAPYFYSERLKELNSGLSIWSQNGTDFGGRNLALWLSPIMVVYGAFNKYLGFGNDVIVRILFYFPSVILAGLGPYFLTRYLKLSKTVQFFSSLFYLLNTYFILLIDGGQVGIALSYGVFPFVILFWKKFFDGYSTHKFAVAFFATVALCYIDPRIAIISFLVIFLWQILEGRVINLLWLILAGILLIPINASWLLPIIKGGGGGLSTSVTDLQLSSLLNSLFLFAPHWPSNIFGKVVQPFFYFALVPTLVFGGLMLKKVDKKYYIFSLIFLFFAFLAKGSAPPMGTWYEFFISKVPFGSIFRDSSKFFIPMLLLGGVLIGNTVDTISNQFRNTYLKWFVFGVAYLYLLLLISPALLGKMNFNLSARRESEDYQTIYTNLNQGNSSFETLWFNEKPQVAFETLDKPALSANQLTAFRPFASINEGEDAYNFLNNPGFVNWLRVFGVKYIILSGDPRNIYPTDTDVKNWEEINKLIWHTPGLTKENWGTRIPVFKIEDPRPNIYSIRKLVLVVGSDIVPTDKVPTVVYAESGKFDPKVLEKVNSDSLKIMFNGGNVTDLSMSFLQRYFKSVGDTSNSGWAVYGSNQYLKYKYELLIRDYRLRDFDFGCGMAFSTKNGEKINFIFDIPRDGKYVIAKRVGTKAKQKLTWNFEPKTLKSGKFEIEIENQKNLEVLNTIAVIPEDEFNDSIKQAERYMSRFGISDSSDPSLFEWHDVSIGKNDGLTKEYKIGGNDRWLIFTQNFDLGWESDIPNLHLPVFSMINGFYLGDTNQITVKFADEKYLKLGNEISLGSILTLLVSYLAYAISRKPR